jgi:hypothetical protein
MPKQVQGDKRKLTGLAHRLVLSGLHMGKQCGEETLNKLNNHVRKLQWSIENGSASMHP